MFVLVSALCGVLVAAVAMPAVGAACSRPGRPRTSLNDLPVAFDTPAQSQRSTVLDANGDVLAYFYEENRVYVELDEIAPIMRQAMIAIEDHRFYEHGPLDLQGTLRAFITNLAAGGVDPGRVDHHPAVREDGADRGSQEEGRRGGIEAAQDGTLRAQDPRACGTPSRSRRR